MMTYGDCNIENVRDEVRRNIWESPSYELLGMKNRSGWVTNHQVSYAHLPIAAPLRSWP